MKTDSREADDQFRRFIEDGCAEPLADRKSVSVQSHADFRASLATPPAVDPIDQLVEELRAAEFEWKGSKP